MRIHVLAVAAAAFTSVASAQCRPPASSNEARLLAFYSVPIVFSADPSATLLAPGSVRLAIEGAYVPTPSAQLQHTDYCYTGRAQNTTLTSVFGRPRIAIGLPYGFGIEASYLPSITVSDATPNLASAAIWFTARARNTLTFTLRAHGTHGTVRGPITCPASALQQSDAQAPCYGTGPSRDQFTANMVGGEALATWTPGNWSRLRLSGGLGVNALRPRFRVGFSDLNGGTDHTRIAVSLTRATGFAGALLRVGSACDIGAQAYASFSDAGTVRAVLGCTLLR